jgi:hypothetical protein
MDTPYICHNMFRLIEPSSGIWFVYIHLYLSASIPTLARHFTHNMMQKYNICVTLVLTAWFRAEDIVHTSELVHIWKLLKSDYKHRHCSYKTMTFYTGTLSGISKHETLNILWILKLFSCWWNRCLFTFTCTDGAQSTDTLELQQNGLCASLQKQWNERLFHILEYVHFSINRTESDETNETWDSL